MEQNFLFLTKPHFNLRNPKDVKPTNIYLVFRIYEKQYKISLGVKVRPAYWNKQLSQAIISPTLCQMEIKNNMVVNQKISEILFAYNNFLNYICTQNIVNIQECINKFFMATRKKRTIKKMFASARLTQALNNAPIKESSYRIFKGTLDDFCAFLKKNNLNELSLEELTFDILNDFKAFLFSKKETHKYTGEKVSLQNNTVKTSMSRLATLFGYCDFESKELSKVLSSIKIFKQDENQVYLNEEEINILMNIELEDKLSIIRDLFIFQLSIFQRWSDVEQNLGKRIFIENNTITIIQKKTGKKVVVPVDERAKAILEKYNYVLPAVSYRTVEKELKNICKKCGFNQEIECVELRNNEEYRYTVHKYQMIGTHTGRRTAITNALKNDISAQIIKKVSGHTTDESFAKYNRMASEDAAQFILAHKNPSKTTGNISGNDLNAPAEQLSTTSKTNEYKRVLTMLGVSPVEWIDLEDEEELFRQIVYAENDIIEILGCDYYFLKEIFNNPNLSMRDKVKTISDLIQTK